MKVDLVLGVEIEKKINEKILLVDGWPYCLRNLPLEKDNHLKFNT